MWFVKSRRAKSDTDFETWVEGGVSPTLNAFDNTGDSRATVVIAFDNSYRDGLRLQKGDTINTLTSKMGTGGNNVPFVAQETDMTDVNGSDVAATLRGFGHGWQGQHNSTNAVAQETDMTDAIPIQDGRGMEKHQNGFGVGIEGDPSYTLDQTGGQSVAIPIQGTIIGRQDHNGPQGKGFGNPGDPSYTLDSVSQHGVATTMQVRRLTPIECIRLMGWRDDHLEIGTLDAPDQDYARQVVRHLWRGLQPYENQRQTRGFWGVLTPEILLAAVRLGWISWNVAGECATRARQVQGEDSWPEAFMCRLRENTEHRPSPYGREPFEQLARELGRPLPFLSFETTSPAKGLFYLGLYEQAQGSGFLQQALDSMEKMGRPFVYQERVKELSDTTRYKMCGNGVASPVAQWIGKQIMAVHRES